MDQEYTQKLSGIETELERWLPKNKIDTAWLNQVFASMGGRTEKLLFQSLEALKTPLDDILSRGGKRWRPLLMTLVCEMLGGGAAAVPLTPAVEFAHNASLIHDDIEDGSDERRGKPAIHKIYGIDTAINSGSFFYFLSSCCIENCAFQNKEQIFKIWMEYIRRLHLGQAMDINWHSNVLIIPEIEDYLLMCRMKTGSLARLAAELGAYAAGAHTGKTIPQEAIRLLGEAADMMGIGFQILDDVKNLTTGIPGKRKGDDIVEGKKSLPVLLYLNKYPERRERVFYCFHMAKREGTTAPEVEELTENLKATGIFTEAEEIAAALLNEIEIAVNSDEISNLAGEPWNININENSRGLLSGFIELIS